MSKPQRAYETFVFREDRDSPESARIVLVDVPVERELIEPPKEKRTFANIFGRRIKVEPSVRESLDLEAVRKIVRAGDGSVRIATLYIESKEYSDRVVRRVLHGFYSDFPLGIKPDGTGRFPLPLREFKTSLSRVPFMGDMLLFFVEETEYFGDRPYESKLLKLPLDSVQLERAFGVF